MTFDPNRRVSSPELDVIIGLNRPEHVTCLAHEVRDRRARDEEVDLAAREAGFDALPDHHADPAVVIRHLVARAEERLKEERLARSKDAERIAAEKEKLCRTIDELKAMVAGPKTYVVAVAGAEVRCGTAREAVELAREATAQRDGSSVTHAAPQWSWTREEIAWVRDALARRRSSGSPRHVSLEQRDRAVAVARRYAAGDSVDEVLGVTPADLALALASLADAADRRLELVRKLDAGVDRITEALGFAPGGADFDTMVNAVRAMRRERETTRERAVPPPVADCAWCGATGVRVVDGRLEPHAAPGRLKYLADATCRNLDPATRPPIQHECPTCGAPAHQGCRSSVAPCTVGEGDGEWHQARVDAALAGSRALGGW